MHYVSAFFGLFRLRAMQLLPLSDFNLGRKKEASGMACLFIYNRIDD